MNTLNLTIPLTIHQLAEMLRTQFSAAERQQLVALVLAEPEDSPVAALPSVADDLREAFAELKRYQRGEIQLQSLDDVLKSL